MGTVGDALKDAAPENPLTGKRIDSVGKVAAIVGGFAIVAGAYTLGQKLYNMAASTAAEKTGMNEDSIAAGGI